MSALDALARGRAAAEALMVDACTIKRLDTQTTDSETGQVTNTYTEIYSGKCKVQRSGLVSVARPQQVGQAQLYTSTLELHVPMSVTGANADDLVSIDTSMDPDLVGRDLHLRELAHKTYATARRFGLTEVS